LAGWEARVLGPLTAVSGELDSFSCQVAFRDGSRRPELGIREAPQLSVMSLVVLGQCVGAAGFQGQEARCVFGGLRLEGRRGLPLCEKIGVGYVLVGVELF
jgi:hypothetical protein